MAYVGQQLEDHAAKAPGATALRCGLARLSWHELVENVRRLEAELRSRTPRGGRVALLARDPVALLIGFLACARTARLAMVFDADWPEAQIADLLAELQPHLILGRERQGAKHETSGSAGTLGCTDGEPPAEEDLFYAGFTSGSTGRPKGYQRTHGSWLRSFHLGDLEFTAGPQLTAPARIVIPGRLSHSLHLYGAVYGLSRGAEVVLSDRFDPRVVLADLKGAERGAALYATPTQLHYLAEAVRRTGPAAQVRQVFASGAKWGDDDRRAMAALFPEAELHEFYGASETSFITVSKSTENVPEGSVGRAAAGVQIAIGEPGAPNGPDAPGPIWVKSDLLFSGYICGAAPETIWKDGWLTFGDQGFIDENGFLFLTGRASRMIVTAGLNVYPEEIEAVLLRHPWVAVAVVTGVADPVRGERLEAYVQLSQTVETAEDALLRHCRDLLPAGKVPRALYVKDRLPLTAGGKPDIQKILAGS